MVLILYYSNLHKYSWIYWNLEEFSRNSVEFIAIRSKSLQELNILNKHTFKTSQILSIFHIWRLFLDLNSRDILNSSQVFKKWSRDVVGNMVLRSNIFVERQYSFWFALKYYSIITPYQVNSTLQFLLSNFVEQVNNIFSSKYIWIFKYLCKVYY